MQLVHILNSHKKSVSVITIGVGLLLLSLIAFISQSFLSSQKGVEIIDAQSDNNSSVDKSEKIYVEVSGAVKKPGVYAFNPGDRVEDALNMSGGITNNSNLEFVSKSINRAAKLIDGQKIYIPFENEQKVLGTTSNQININEASTSELESLPGVGAVTAKKIIDNRPYSELNDLLSKKVLSQKVFDQVKDNISVY